MTLSEELAWRGQIKDKTFSDITWLDTPRTFYLGADAASADSLTIGNLAVYMLARRLAKHGWKTVLLLGGATSLIGDPGGKESERDLTPRKEIERNIAGIKAQVERLFAGLEFTMVDNYDWFSDIGYLEFLRDVGKHYSMTELVQRDFIANRMGEGGEGISYAEFSYSLIQGYDYWHLYKTLGVELQIGGSDQWGNMLSGAPLIRKKEGVEVHALSMPLVINRFTGKKFGKSENGAVWLDPTKTTPTAFYQFWINADDDGVEEYLRIYTELNKVEINQILQAHTQAPAERIAQKHLAQEVTRMVHGQDAEAFAEHVTALLTGQQPIGEASDEAIAEIKSQLPHAAVEDGSMVTDALVATGLASSISEARRLLEGNAIAVNNNKLTSQSLTADLFQNNKAMLRKGKKYKDSALLELNT